MRSGSLDGLEGFGRGMQELLGERPITPLITMDRDSYQAELGELTVGGEVIWYLDFTILMTYTNRSDRPVYMGMCGGPFVPVLERLVNGSWETAYSPPQTACGGVGNRIDPGEVYSDYRFQVLGHDRKSDVRPSWLPDEVDGSYRVHWFLSLFTEPDWRADQVPLEERVSNTFQLTGTIP